MAPMTHRPKSGVGVHPHYDFDTTVQHMRYQPDPIGEYSMDETRLEQDKNRLTSPGIIIEEQILDGRIPTGTRQPLQDISRENSHHYSKEEMDKENKSALMQSTIADEDIQATDPQYTSTPSPTVSRHHRPGPPQSKRISRDTRSQYAQDPQQSGLRSGAARSQPRDSAGHHGNAGSGDRTRSADEFFFQHAQEEDRNMKSVQLDHLLYQYQAVMEENEDCKSKLMDRENELNELNVKLAYLQELYEGACRGNKGLAEQSRADDRQLTPEGQGSGQYHSEIREMLDKVESRFCQNQESLQAEVNRLRQDIDKVEKESDAAASNQNKEAELLRLHEEKRSLEQRLRSLEEENARLVDELAKQAEAGEAERDQLSSQFNTEKAALADKLVQQKSIHETNLEHVSSRSNAEKAELIERLENLSRAHEADQEQLAQQFQEKVSTKDNAIAQLRGELLLLKKEAIDNSCIPLTEHEMPGNCCCTLECTDGLDSNWLSACDSRLYQDLQLYKVDQKSPTQAKNLIKNILIQLQLPLDNIMEICHYWTHLQEGRRLRKFFDELFFLMFKRHIRDAVVTKQYIHQAQDRIQRTFNSRMTV